MEYSKGNPVKVGDVITDGTSGREDVRLKNRAKVLYVDRFNLVWFPLNDFTKHNESYPKSNTWGLTMCPKKVELKDLTEEELKMYNTSDEFLIW